MVAFHMPLINKEIDIKEVKAIIRPFKLLDASEALKEIEGLPGIIVSEIRGFSKGRAKTQKIKYFRNGGLCSTYTCF